ncbi:hypothetical protein Tco_0292735, partial [Tanacetum coccineum]
TWIDHDDNGIVESQSSSTGFLPSRRRYEFHSGGGVNVEKKASPNKWQILMESRLDAGKIHRSG